MKHFQIVIILFIIVISVANYSCSIKCDDEENTPNKKEALFQKTDTLDSSKLD